VKGLAYESAWQWFRDWLRPHGRKLVSQDRYGTWLNPSPFNRRGWWTYCGWKDLPDWLWLVGLLGTWWRISTWWYHWSFPLRKTTRCPFCNGTGMQACDYGDLVPCDCRTGRRGKWNRHFWHVLP